MKKLFTIAAFALSSLSMMAEDYSCPLLVVVEGNSQPKATQTVSVTQQKDGKYSLSLKNFKMGSIPVGNIEVNDVDAMTCGTTICLSTQQTIQITAGDDASVKWTGPGLGDVPILLKGELNGGTFNAILSISMVDPESPMNVRVELGDVENIGQIPNSNFEAFHEEKSGINKEYQADHWHSFINCVATLATSAAKMKHNWKSNDVRPGTTGTYSLEVKSRKVAGQSANGTVTTGRINAGSMTADDPANCSFLDLSNKEKDKKGDPYYTILTCKPDAIEFWTKFFKGAREESNKDNIYATISAAITDGTYYQDPQDNDNYTNVVATAKNDKIESLDNTWQKLTVPFNYNKTDKAAKAILVTISTCSVPGGGSLSDKDGEQDAIKIDDMRLVYNANATSIKFKGEELTEEEGIYYTAFDGEVKNSDIEVETDSKTAYVSKSLLKFEDDVVAIINIVSNDLKTANRYIVSIEGATTTGINKPQTVTTQSGVKAVYNLSGQQVSGMSKAGVYIVERNDGTTVKVLKK